MNVKIDSDIIEKAIKELNEKEMKLEDGRKKGLFDAYDVGRFIGALEFHIEHERGNC